MTLSGELSTPLIGIDDPVACLIHLTAACWFAWQAQRLVRRAGKARRRAAALAVFAVTAVGVLAISATYHGLPMQHPWKGWLQRIDHAAIFLLIAGTITSFYAIGFSGSGRLWMVGLVWAIAVGALTSKLAAWSSIGDGAGLVPYFGLSAIGGSSIAFLPRTLSWRALAPLVLGVVIYMSGALTDLWLKGWLIPHVLGPHEIFHLAVVGALLMHWRFFHDWAIPAPLPAEPLSGVAAAIL